MRVISSVKDDAFRAAVALTRPAERAAARQYLVEGIGFVRQAVASPSPVHAVYALEAEATALEPQCTDRDIPLYVIGPGMMTKLSGTSYETAITAVAIVAQRVIDDTALPVTPDTILLVGEHIQDPRNVGVLIRTAEAAGCGALILSDDSAEPYTRAAVRSTTGSVLRLPLCLPPDLPSCLRRLRERGYNVVASSARAPQVVYDTDLSRGPLALVVGNETAGITDAVRDAASGFVALPMAPDGASSLNVTVAAGVLLYEALRQRRG